MSTDTTSQASVNVDQEPEHNSLAPYDITVFSIFRDSMSYLKRYLNQMEGLARLYPTKTFHWAWLEGDSADDTFRRLREYALEMNANSKRIRISLKKFDTGGRYWPSIDHGPRWAQLAKVWNENMLQQVETEFAICVESDLIWDPQVVMRELHTLRQHRLDVIYPMLMYTDIKFYDTHATKSLDGEQWQPYPPYCRQYGEKRLIPVVTSGGMILARGEVMEMAVWGIDDCILTFPPGLKKAVDTKYKILHPQHV